MLRYLKFNGIHPFPLTQRRIRIGRAGFNLFAREMPETVKGVKLHGWTEALIDAENGNELPAVLRPRPGPCYWPKCSKVVGNVHSVNSSDNISCIPSADEN
jgi:hypothetical protein